MVSLECLQKKERMMRFQKSHMQIHEAYQFLHKKRTAQVTVAKRQKLLSNMHLTMAYAALCNVP